MEIRQGKIYRYEEMRESFRRLVRDTTSKLEIMFGIAEWLAVIALASFVITVGGKVWQLATRLSDTEAKAEAAATRADLAGINVAANTIRCETMARLLSEHKERIAEEYVSNRSLEKLENRLVEAISRLGDRLDKLFRPMTPA